MEAVVDRVIEALECNLNMVTRGDCEKCGYECRKALFVRVPVNMLNDALELLKAQEPVEPRVGHDGWYRCGGCNNSLASGERVKHFYGHPWPKYCEECGREVKWE